MIKTLITVRESSVVDVESSYDDYRLFRPNQDLLTHKDYILDELALEEDYYVQLISSSEDALILEVECDDEDEIRDFMVTLTYVILGLDIYNYSVSITTL